MAGATTGTLAVVLGLTSLTADDPTATETPPATQLTTDAAGHAGRVVLRRRGW